jgi:outer membrane cobalamin receptor
MRALLLLSLLVTVIALAAPVTAQDSPPVPESTADPEGEVTVLDEIVVTATRHESKLFKLPYAGESRSEEEIASDRQAKSFPDALRDSPSVSLQKTAP